MKKNKIIEQNLTFKEYIIDILYSECDRGEYSKEYILEYFDDFADDMTSKELIELAESWEENKNN